MLNRWLRRYLLHAPDVCSALLQMAPTRLAVRRVQVQAKFEKESMMAVVDGHPKAIETLYRGYRFRSRLEARWAVFYDALGVPWEYEREGYDLGELGWYLPDFWLPKQQAWVEIKPVDPTSAETDRGMQLAKQTGHDLYLFFGQIPMPVNVWELDQDSLDGAHKCFGGGDGWDNFHQWCECPACGLIGIEFDGRADRLDCRLTQCPGDGVRQDRGHNVGSPRLIAAYTAARQARFGTGGRG